MVPRLSALSLALLAVGAPAAAAAPRIERVARVPAAHAALAGDDRYVAVAAGERSVRVYDTRRRRTLRFRGTCSRIVDLEGHRMLVALRAAGCAPALVALGEGTTGAPFATAPAVASGSCPLRGRSRVCPEGTLVEDYVALAGQWILGVTYTVGRLERVDQRVVARRIDTGERTVLFSAPAGGGVEIESAQGDRAVLAVDEPGGQEGEIFPNGRVAVDLRSGELEPVPASEYLFGVDAGRALVSDNGPVRVLTLRRLPGSAARSTRIRLRRPVRIHRAAANAGAVAWMVQRRRPRRLAINLLVPSGRERLFVSHRPPRPRDDYLCARILPTRHAVVWSVIPGLCNRRLPVDYYAVPRRTR
jgi:hypothetical protein